VIDDDGQVPVAFAVADLVDPDPAQIGEQVALADGFGGDALADRADRAPRDPQQLGDGLLGTLDR
jgi:hypothetical protein